MEVKSLYLLGLVLSLSLVSATIEVHDSTFTTEYYYGETIFGNTNLTFNNQELNVDITSSRGDSMSLEDFLFWNGARHTCKPLDCSNGFASLFSDTNLPLTMDGENEYYLGFVLNGKDVSVSSLNFDISSTFTKGTTTPLEINFFEDVNWQFSEFSDTFSTKQQGCFDPTQATIGPYIGSATSYCELISIEETAAIKTGAEITGTDDKEIRMIIYPGEGGSSLGSCLYDPSKAETECLIEADTGNTFSKGEYQICAGSDYSTNYKIKTETTGTTCGFPYAVGPSNSIKDYAVFVKTANYQDATFLSNEDFNMGNLVLAADDLINRKYAGDCSNGCFLPIKITGKAQTLTMNNLNLRAQINFEEQQENKIHKLAISPATINYQGTLDLGTTDFNITKEGLYELFIGNTKIVSREVTIIPEPVIVSLYPANPPAIIPVLFTANVEYAGNKTGMEYRWNFGDGTIISTKEKSVEHTYQKTGNYTIILEASINGLNDKKVFNILSITPREAVNETLTNKKLELNNILNKINGFPNWYQGQIKTLSNIETLNNKITKLDQQEQQASTDNDYTQIAKELFILELPQDINLETQSALKLASNPYDFDAEPIITYTGEGDLNVKEEYQSPMQYWQTTNIDARILSETITLTDAGGNTEGIMRAYTMDLLSKGTENGYFIIQKPLSDLTFRKDVGAQAVGDVTLIPLTAGQDLSLSFSYEDTEPILMYASPSLAAYVIEQNVDNSCNNNFICEENLGEDWLSCRNDCKPTKQAWQYFGLGLLGVFILYTLLQLWYRKRYETHLFADKRQLYNLLMYISNARARGQNDETIAEELEQQGWSGERITYAIRKSRGKTTGLPEIIPFSKFAAHKRNKLAQQQLAQGNQMNAPTGQY